MNWAEEDLRENQLRQHLVSKEKGLEYANPGNSWQRANCKILLYSRHYKIVIMVVVVLKVLQIFVVNAKYFKIFRIINILLIFVFMNRLINYICQDYDLL